MAPAFAGRDFALGLVAGGVVVPVLVLALYFIVLGKSDFYGVDHWKLNVRTPFKTMWMNLGYWKRADGSDIEHFDEACCALLHKILDISGALNTKSTDTKSNDATSPSSSPSSKDPLAIIDLGFGCGDQTWELARQSQVHGPRPFRYVGLTLNEAQKETASRRIQRELVALGGREEGVEADEEGEGEGEMGTDLKMDSFKLFCADAAKPSSWSPRVQSAINSISNTPSTSKWLLALDCLYHFTPSRAPIFTQASTLNAQIMAFDLILNPTATRWQTLLARAGCLLMGCPLHAFLTAEQYTDQLVSCGYERELVSIEDVSDEVFGGVARFLERQERGLQRYGVFMGGFKLAGRIFGWYDRTRVVRASIVVARRSEGE